MNDVICEIKQQYETKDIRVKELTEKIIRAIFSENITESKNFEKSEIYKTVRDIINEETVIVSEDGKQKENYKDSTVFSKTASITTFEDSEFYKETRVGLRSILLTEKTKPKLQNQDITKRIKTFGDACAELGINHNSIQTLELDGYTKVGIDYIKLCIIAEALNEGWKPNWEDSNERKWYPYFRLGGSFGLYGTGYNYDYADTSVASRFCFKTETLARYAGTQFIEIYKDYYTK